MGKWNADNLMTTVTTGNTSLQSAVVNLNPKTKQAMYAAGKKGPIVKRSWSGCAFNAAGEELDVQVASTMVAAQTFDLPYDVVSKFIQTWDNGDETTEDLISIILEVGLYTEAGENKPKLHRLNKVMLRTYTSWETRMKEELDFDIEQDVLPVGTEEAAELIFAGV